MLTFFIILVVYLLIGFLLGSAICLMNTPAEWDICTSGEFILFCFIWPLYFLILVFETLTYKINNPLNNYVERLRRARNTRETND